MNELTEARVRSLIASEVEARISALGLEQLIAIAQDEATADRETPPDIMDGMVQPLNPSPLAGVAVFFAECYVHGHGTGKTWKRVQIGGTTITLTDDATNYLWAEVDLSRESLDGTFYFAMDNANLIANTDATYNTTTATGELPGSTTGIRVIPLGTITVADGAVTDMDVKRGHIWFCAPEIALPEGEQGDILYHDGDDWVVLDNPGSSSYGHALTLKDDGSIPEWVAIERVKVVRTVEIDGGELRMTRADIDVIRKQDDDDYETIVELGTCE